MKWNTLGLFATPLVKIELDGAGQAKQYFDSHVNKEDHKETNIEGEYRRNKRPFRPIYYKKTTFGNRCRGRQPPSTLCAR